MGSICGWGSKILHSTEQVSLHATTRESVHCNARFHMMQERSHVLWRLQVSHQFYLLLVQCPKAVYTFVLKLLHLWSMVNTFRAWRTEQYVSFLLLRSFLLDG